MYTRLSVRPLFATEVLSPSEHAALLQRSEILEECEQGRNRCYTLKSVEKIMKKVKTFNAVTPPFQQTLNTKRKLTQVQTSSKVKEY